MTRTLVVLSLAGALLCFAVVLVVVGVPRDGPRAASTDPSLTAPAPGSTSFAPELAGLRAEVDRLSAELEALRRAQAARAPAGELVLPPTAPGASPSPAAYLAEYVASFADGGEGAEYFRLAVDAYAPQLVEEIGALVADRGRPPALRRSLVAMLATPRFEGNDRALDALLAALRSRASEAFLSQVVLALDAVADDAALPRLEAAVFDVPASVRPALIDAVVALAGLRRNEALLRMLLVSSDAATSALLVARLDGADLAHALQALRAASAQDVPARLAAAEKLREFPEPEFRAFVAEWRAVETDERVRAMLDATDEPREVPSWDALRATGPPDASADRDDPNAWATKVADGGRQWLELVYDPPRVAESARIFEVNTAGAVVELLARSKGGEWTTVWAGEDPTQEPGPFHVPFDRALEVHALRVVLDTDSRPGWNEVDAVELIGPNGSAWATFARASSTYGQ